MQILNLDIAKNYSRDKCSGVYAEYLLPELSQSSTFIRQRELKINFTKIYQYILL